MNAQVLLLRGINVGGHGKLPMADLRDLLDAMGAGGAKTHVQSGNVVCPCAVSPDALAEAIEAQHGFRPHIFAVTAQEWRARVATNPFPTDPGKALHGFFHDGSALDTSVMGPILAKSERLSPQSGVLWLHAPEGIGRSKIATAVERLAKRPVTARNWNTVAAITSLLGDI